MDLSDDHILEFQTLYKKHFGTEITKEQALEKGLRLIRLIKVVSRAVADERNDTQNSAKNPRGVPCKTPTT
jgi:hypothetical protein